MSENSDLNHQSLVAAALAAKKRAYAPYSRFQVGAALVDDRGRMFTGCNIENASYGATCCAERTAIFKAVSEGAHKIRRLAVVCDDADYCRPCGICRQVMSEFAAADFQLISAKPDGSFIVLTMNEILPFAFTPDHLT